MKLSDFVLVLSILMMLSGFIKAADPEKDACPEAKEIDGGGCKCYASVLSMICHELTKPFELANSYHLNKLQIKNSQNLHKLTEHSGSFHLKVDNLIISQEADSPSAAPTLDHLEKVLKITTKSIKIVSRKDLPNQVLDVTFLSDQLTSLTITNVGSLDGFAFDHFGHLETIQLHEVKFSKEIKNVELYDTPLTHVEISNTANLIGSFLFEPKDCKDDQKIHIDLQDSKGLDYFDFSQLFKSDKCHYHIDLTGTSMRKDLLTSQANILTVQKAGSFYIILSGVPNLECNCYVYELYQKFPDYIHSVQCSNLQGKYLDQIAREVACPPPTTPH